MATYQLGILGGGQLARMSVMAAQRMGIAVVSLDKDENSPAAQVGPAIFGSIHNSSDIAEVMRVCDFVTFENEFIRAETLEEACRIADFPRSHVIPGIDTLRTVQDKLLQRQAYLAEGVPSPQAVNALEAEKLGFPCVLKARYGGYDGKGTRYVNTKSEYDDLKHLWESGEWLAEELVSFDFELAVMVVVSKEGFIDSFPTMVTRQKNYVCDLVYPCLDPTLDVMVQSIARDAVKAVKGVGLFGVELFQHEDGNVSVNEIAPRPHNTGHYTLDWGGLSQFEAHVQVAIGSFSKVTHGLPTCMANILGSERVGSHLRAVKAVNLEHPEARIQWYGKAEAKPGRKMGHLNVVGEHGYYGSADDWDLIKKAVNARERFFSAWEGQ